MPAKLPFSKQSPRTKFKNLREIHGNYQAILAAYPELNRVFKELEKTPQGKFLNGQNLLLKIFEDYPDIIGDNSSAPVASAPASKKATKAKKAPRADSAGGEPKRAKKEEDIEDYRGADLSFPANVFASDDLARPPPSSPQLSDDGYFNDIMGALGATPPPADEEYELPDLEGNGYGGATDAQIGRAARYRTHVREALEPPKYECLYRNLSYIIHSNDENAIGNPFSPDDKYDADVQKILDKAEANLKRVKELRDRGIEPRKVPKCSGKVFKPETTPAVQPSVFKASTRKRASASAVDFTAPAKPAPFNFAAIDKLRKSNTPVPVPRKVPLFVPTPELIEKARLKRLEGKGMIGGNWFDDVTNAVASTLFGNGRPHAQYPYLL